MVTHPNVFSVGRRESIVSYIGLLLLISAYYLLYAQYHTRLSPEEALAVAQKVGGGIYSSKPGDVLLA